MSIEYTKFSAKYNQLSSEERGKIEAYYEIGISIAQGDALAKCMY